VLGAVADEAHSPILLPIAGIHHVHVQPSNACAQGVVRCIAAAALDFGPHSLPILDNKHVSQNIQAPPRAEADLFTSGLQKGAAGSSPDGGSCCLGELPS